MMNNKLTITLLAVLSLSFDTVKTFRFDDEDLDEDLNDDWTIERSNTNPDYQRHTDVICPAGKKGSGGVCRCNKAAVWKEGPWMTPYCDNGLCKTKQPYKKCEGKNGHPLGDGTWCWGDKRRTWCPTIQESSDSTALEARIAAVEATTTTLSSTVSTLSTKLLNAGTSLGHLCQVLDYVSHTLNDVSSSTYTAYDCCSNSANLKTECISRTFASGFITTGAGGTCSSSDSACSS